MKRPATVAERLIGRYLERQGGEDSGFAFGDEERELAAAIERELRAAEKRGARDMRDRLRGRSS